MDVKDEHEAGWVNMVVNGRGELIVANYGAFRVSSRYDWSAHLRSLTYSQSLALT
jgi:hypothetical protein